MNIAWIGTGVMGKAMLRHLFNAGHDVSAYNRTYEKAVDLKMDGIQVCKSIQKCVKDADIIFTMVGFPKDVEEVYCHDGIFQHAKKDAIAIDMTTSSPLLANKLYYLGLNYNISVIDAPVSGGDRGAKDATLSIMCGGDKKVFDAIKPILRVLGSNIHYLGKAGNGQHCKAANQICVAGATAAMIEAIHYAHVTGLSPEDMLAAIQGGAAGSWQLNHMASRVLQHDEQPGFYIKHFIKDMKIIQDVMKNHDKQLNMLNTVEEMYEALAENDLDHLGTQALLHFYEDK